MVFMAVPSTSAPTSFPLLINCFCVMLGSCRFNSSKPALIATLASAIAPSIEKIATKIAI